MIQFSKGLLLWNFLPLQKGRANWWIQSLHTEGVKGLDLHVNLCWGSYAWHNFHSTLSTQEYKMVLVRMCACVCGVGGGREVELGEGSGGCNVIPSWLILHQVKESSTDSMGLSFYSWHM